MSGRLSPEHVLGRWGRSGSERVILHRAIRAVNRESRCHSPLWRGGALSSSNALGGTLGTGRTMPFDNRMNRVRRFIVRNHAKDRKSTRLNSSHLGISYAVFCLKKKKKI